ncbi:MAG: KilA-N domain-containing protein, partial [Dolichospermum sp.]
MNNLAVFDYNGQTISRRQNGFINLTQMCQANGKRLDNWTRLKQTQDYIRILANSLTSEVVYSEEGVNGGTWGHPSLAINLARWISPEFAVWCDGHIFNLMSTGSTAIAHQIPKTYSQALLEAAKLAEENERLEAQNILLEQQNECLSEAVDELFNYSSIVRIAKFNGISETRFKWCRLKAVSVKMGLEIKKVP